MFHMWPYPSYMCMFIGSWLFCSFKHAFIVFIINMQEADLVTTHELGHNFGAEHDPDNIPGCAPSDEQGGKFVMYPIAVSGDHPNNKVSVYTQCLHYSVNNYFIELIMFNTVADK